MEWEGQGGKRGFLGAPCVEDSLLLGVCSGFVVGFHRFRGVRMAVPAVDWGVKMMCATSLVSFAVCRQRYHAEKAAVTHKIKELNEKQQQREKEVEQ